jgi:hypothetical protein
MANRHTKKCSPSLNHQRNVNENHNEMSITSPTKNGYCQKDKESCWQGCRERGAPMAPLGQCELL